MSGNSLNLFGESYPSSDSSLLSDLSYLFRKSVDSVGKISEYIQRVDMSDGKFDSGLIEQIWIPPAYKKSTSGDASLIPNLLSGASAIVRYAAINGSYQNGRLAYSNADWRIKIDCSWSNRFDRMFDIDAQWDGSVVCKAVLAFDVIHSDNWHYKVKFGEKPRTCREVLWIYPLYKEVINQVRETYLEAYYPTRKRSMPRS